MDWHFRSRSHHCDDCETAFEDKQPYHTILFRGMGSLERRDICPGCWEQKHKTEPGAMGGYISHWQGVYEVPPPPPPEAIQKDNAETLLKKLIEQNTRTYHSFSGRTLASDFARHGFQASARSAQFFLPMFLHRWFGASSLLQKLERWAKAARLTSLLGSPVVLRLDRRCDP